MPTVVSEQCGCSEDFAARNPYTRVFPVGDIDAMTRAITEVTAIVANAENVTKFAEPFSLHVTAAAVKSLLTKRVVQRTA